MHLHRRVRIECAPEPLWRCLTEPELLQRWVSQMVDETPDDPNRASGVGATSTLRLNEGGKIVSYKCVVTEWEPKRRLAVRLSGGSFPQDMHVDVVYQLSQEEMNATLLDYDVEMPIGGWLKLLTPLIRVLAGFTVKRDLSRLETLALSLAA
jgi:uncharacterized protein YndB with AHSA1/START domain